MPHFISPGAPILERSLPAYSWPQILCVAQSHVIGARGTAQQCAPSPVRHSFCSSLSNARPSFPGIPSLLVFNGGALVWPDALHNPCTLLLVRTLLSTNPTLWCNQPPYDEPACMASVCPAHHMMSPPAWLHSALRTMWWACLHCFTLPCAPYDNPACMASLCPAHHMMSLPAWLHSALRTIW